MEMVRLEKNLAWLCWKETGLLQYDERVVTCLCCAALSILCKNAKTGEPVSGNFHFLYTSQLKGSLFCKKTSKWYRGMKSTSQQIPAELMSCCFEMFVFRVK